MILTTLMGLDWHLVSPPLPGKESELAELDAEIAALWEQEDGDDGGTDELYRQIDALQERRGALLDKLDCAAIAGAPRVGVDPEAVAFLLANETLFRPHPGDGDLPWPDHVEQLAIRLHDRYLTEASRDRDALPRFPAGPVSSNRYDFRGQVMLELEPILGEDLVLEAGEPHTAAGCIDYAARIERAISMHREDDGVADLVEAARSVVVWLRYWGERRMGFSPSY